MIIYDVEKEMGLEDAILAHSRATYSVKILEKGSPLDLQKYPLLAKACEQRKLLPDDLFVFDNIQVSSGWNLNDDIFTKEELWRARGTISHKPLNFNHEYNIIIGHTINSHPVDTEYRLITEDVPEESLPDLYHVYATDVIYTKTQNAEFDEYIAELVSQIRKGEWSVSMECRMNDFDYGFAKDGVSSIIRRDATTANLTQHLRLFGGSGTFNGFRIGRVFRGINFIGKGVVKTPANPFSIIFSEKLFSLGYSTLDTFAKANLENTMDKDVATLDSKVTELETTLADVRKDLAAAQDEAEVAKKDKEEFKKKFEKAEEALAEEKLNSEKFNRVVRVKSQAESLFKKLASDDLLTLFTEVAAFVEENKDLDEKAYAKVEEYFVKARKSDEAAKAAVAAAEKSAVADKDPADDVDEEEVPAATASATVEVEDENPFALTEETSLAIASYLKGMNKNAFRSLKETN